MSTVRAFPEPVVLECGPWHCAVRPDLGGSLASLDCAAVAVLRHSDAATLASPRDSACFPLVPYSNRIRQRRFHWLGQDHVLADNFPDSPHCLHGTAWLRPWTVVQHSPQALVLQWQQTPDAHWPFAFLAEQRIALRSDGLHCTLSVSNTDTCPQPVGLGWHPYFPGHLDATLRMQVSGIWLKDEEDIPVRCAPHAPIAQPLAGAGWDHCFDGWDGEALICYPFHSIKLNSSERKAVVFTPNHGQFFCVEPVSHVNNAINAPEPSAQGLRILQSGQTAQATMSICLEPQP